MKIRQLIIKNFRGIKSLEFKVIHDFNVFIGPGDSTKTTILDAIALVLSPYWNVSITDNDFYNFNLQSNIEIFATIVEIPDKLIKAEKFGLNLRGWSPDHGVVDEPNENTIEALTIHFVVDKNLEPEWFIYNDRIQDEIHISAQDRMKLGMNFIELHSQKDFTWGRTSALSRMSLEKEEISNILANANREAKKAVSTSTFDQLSAIANEIESNSAQFGVRPREKFQPGLDSFGYGFGASSLALHDGPLPVRYFGEGTKRLLSIAIQTESNKEGGIILIDELEIGLEPYRLRGLINILKTNQNNNNQYFITTHSAFSLLELNANDLFVTRNHEGKTIIQAVSEDLQDVVRRMPEAFLARKIVICEGKTELGFSFSLANYWKSESEINLSYQGVIFVDGNGDSAIRYSEKMNLLGYEVCYWADSDKYSMESDEIKNLIKKNIKVIIWEDSCSIEEQILLELPKEDVPELLSLACDLQQISNDRFIQSLNSKTSLDISNFDEILNAFDNSDDEREIRKLLGKFLKNKTYFKNVEKGEKLGDFVIPKLKSTPTSKTMEKIEELKSWCND